MAAPLPNWKRGDNRDTLNDHLFAEAAYERYVGDVLQIVERTMLRDRPTQDVRPGYRLVEVKAGKAKAIHTAELRACWTQHEVRHGADRRARRLHLRSGLRPLHRQSAGHWLSSDCRVEFVGGRSVLRGGEWSGGWWDAYIDGDNEPCYGDRCATLSEAVARVERDMAFGHFVTSESV